MGFYVSLLLHNVHIYLVFFLATEDVQSRRKLHPSLGIPFPSSDELRARSDELRSQLKMSPNKASFPIDIYEWVLSAHLRDIKKRNVK